MKPVSGSFAPRPCFPNDVYIYAPKHAVFYSAGLESKRYDNYGLEEWRKREDFTVVKEYPDRPVTWIYS